MRSRTERARLLFATTSAGKLREGRALLEPAGIELLGLGDVGLAGGVVEDAPDYEGNARLKARAAAAGSGLAALGDDSGLEVAALAGGPGLLSARFGGATLDDAGRVALLLERLSAVPSAARGARFVCVLVLVGADGGDRAVVRGTCAGRIALAARGGGGFGYDPVFEFGARGCTFGELDDAGKCVVSHRGQAFRALAARLREGV